MPLMLKMRQWRRKLLRKVMLVEMRRKMDETPMVDIPIIAEKKKPRRKAKKQELPIDELAEKLAPFTYRNERSGRVSLQYMI